MGLARSRADALNTYDQLLHPFDGWTFGAYAHEVGQFGIGEAKGFANFGAQTLTLGLVSEPFAASGESQADGAGTAGTLAFVGSFFTGGGEVAAVEGGAAKALAGAESKAVSSGFTANPLDFIGEPTEAFPEAQGAFAKVANSDAFLNKAGIARGSADHEALNTALNGAEYRRSGFQGGWAGIGANGKTVLGISRGNLNNKVALSHELHHLVRHVKGITPFESEAQMRGIYRYRAWAEEAKTYYHQFFGYRK